MRAGALHVGDLHLSDSTHDKMLAWRPAESWAIARAIGAYVVAHPEIRVVVLPGDVFHGPRPAPWAVAIFHWLVIELRKTTQVRVLFGNHDADPADGVGPLSTNFLDVYERVDQPRLEDFGTLNAREFQLLYLPWASRAQLGSLRSDLTTSVQHAMMADAIKDIVALRLEFPIPNVPIVVSTHFSISGVTYNSETQPQIGEASEFMLPRQTFPSYIDLVVAGHVHKPQDLPHIEGVADVVYTGATHRRDFGEEKQECGMLVTWFDGDSVSYERIELPAQRFLTVDVQYDGKTINTRYFSKDSAEVNGAIVRIKGSEIPAGAEAASVLAAIRRNIIEAGALKLADDAILYTRHEHRAVSTITTATSPRAALEEYAEAVGGDYLAPDGSGHLRADLAELHSTLLEEVQHEG